MSGVGRRGFGGLGSGRLSVTPPPLYRPGAVYAVASAGAERLIAADSAGRLSFSVDMGPSHAAQRYRIGAAATLGWQKAAVTIARAG